MKPTYFTPVQAKKLWCPMVRASNGTDEPANCGNSEPYRTPDYARCIADKCAMWRWTYEMAMRPTVKEDGTRRYTVYAQQRVFEQGYCGLAGRPELGQ